MINHQIALSQVGLFHKSTTERTQMKEKMDFHCHRSQDETFSKMYSNSISGLSGSGMGC